MCECTRHAERDYRCRPEDFRFGRFFPTVFFSAVGSPLPFVPLARTRYFLRFPEPKGKKIKIKKKDIEKLGNPDKPRRRGVGAKKKKKSDTQCTQAPARVKRQKLSPVICMLRAKRTRAKSSRCPLTCSSYSGSASNKKKKYSPPSQPHSFESNAPLKSERKTR
jgi:hypothetical protein